MPASWPERGARVTVTDLRNEAALASQLAELAAWDIRKVLGRHDEGDFTGADLIVVSPGVPQDHPLLVNARSAGREIVSEIELAARFIDVPLVAITGTNGKTTTTTLAGEIFRGNGYRTFVGGNIGNPLIELVESGEPVDQVVAEISSFQLEWITTFRPRVAALLNLSEDHLDRYASYREYIDAKLRIFENQAASDFAVVNRDDKLVWRYAQGLKAQLFPFSRKQELEEGIFHRDGVIIYRHNGREERFPTSGHPPPGGAQPGEHHGRPGLRAALGLPPGRQLRDRSRLWSSAPPHGVRGRGKRRPLLRGQQGHQRGERGKGAGKLRRASP